MKAKYQQYMYLICPKVLPAESRLTNWKESFSAVTSVGLASAKLTISMRYSFNISKNSSCNFSNCGDSKTLER